MEKMTVLLVDDKEENLIALESLLDRDDIRIVKTTSPNEALKLAWEMDVAIALVDVQMPEMDGFELVQILKSNPKTKDILVIFVTAISKEDKYTFKGLTGGAIDYLHKPLDPYITTAKVENFVLLARTQRELKSKNRELEIYSIMVNNSADVIGEIDPGNFKIRTINPSVEAVLGFEPRQVIGKSFLDLINPEEKDAVIQHFDTVTAEPRSTTSFEVRAKNLRGELMWVECKVSFHAGVLSFNMSDIQAKREHQQSLVRAKDLAEESRRVKENFLANMSHELRTPINGIMGVTRLLKGTKLDEQQKQMLELIDTSSKSLLGVINDVLDLSKIEAGKFAIVRGRVEVRNTVKSVVDLLSFRAAEKDLQIILDIDGLVPKFIHADGLRLNQILMNLVGNAIKFTDKGFVKVRVEVTETKGNKVKLAFSVRDTGIGIAENKLQHIFDTYAQADDSTARKFGGTGLGLTIVKKLAELKGGKLEVSSELGVGSTFTFINWCTVLPEEETEEITDMASLKPFDNLKVLIAEDNMVNQFIAVQLLEEWDATTEVAENGLQVINKLKAGSHYDIILMDTQMPIMDGYEAARKIRNEMPEEIRNIPIISLTAAVMQSEQQQAMDAGMNAVVPKPYDPVELYKKIKLLTGK